MNHYHITIINHYPPLSTIILIPCLRYYHLFIINRYHHLITIIYHEPLSLFNNGPWLIMVIQPWTIITILITNHGPFDTSNPV